MSDRSSETAIKAMIEHGLRPDADVNEQCLAENARALMQELDEAIANNNRLRANLDNVSRVHAADLEALAEAKKQIKDMRGTPVAMMHGLLETLTELGLNDRYSSVPFSDQVRQKLPARYAAQQRAGAVKALEQLADKWVNMHHWQSDAVVLAAEMKERADAIKKGEVAL